MTVKRMDNVGIVVEDIDAAIEFFTELGLELEGRGPVEARILRLRIVRKAVAYITRDGQVLFFRAREAPKLGAELPGGTLVEGEDPVAGVLREAREETGYTEFGVPRALGIVNYDPRDGKDEIHERHFFEIPLLVEAPATWERVVEEGNGVFTFSFFWVGNTTIPKNVYPGHDVFLRNALFQT